jgi:hypothetical protein
MSYTAEPFLAPSSLPTEYGRDLTPCTIRTTLLAACPTPRHQVRHRGALVPPLVSTVEPRFRGGLASCLTNLVRPRRLVRLACLTDRPSVAWSADTGRGSFEGEIARSGQPPPHPRTTHNGTCWSRVRRCLPAPRRDWRPSPLNTIGAASREAQGQGPHGCVWSWHWDNAKTPPKRATPPRFSPDQGLPAGGSCSSRTRGTQAAGASPSA